MLIFALYNLLTIPKIKVQNSYPNIIIWKSDQTECLFRVLYRNHSCYTVVQFVLNDVKAEGTTRKKCESIFRNSVFVHISLITRQFACFSCNFQKVFLYVWGEIKWFFHEPCQSQQIYFLRFRWIEYFIAILFLKVISIRRLYKGSFDSKNIDNFSPSYMNSTK